jgi:hypothetical protein
MPVGPEGAVCEENQMIKNIKHQAELLEEVIEMKENDLKNQSFEGYMDPADASYIQGQISAYREFLEFLEEIQGETNNGSRLECRT